MLTKSDIVRTVIVGHLENAKALYKSKPTPRAAANLQRARKAMQRLSYAGDLSRLYDREPPARWIDRLSA